MSKVVADITMSLDGYVTGPPADSQHGFGDVDELHTWVVEQDPVDTEILERIAAETGAVVMGRRLFDIVDGPNGWTKDMGGTARNWRRRLRSSSSPTRRRSTSGWNGSWVCDSPSWTSCTWHRCCWVRNPAVSGGHAPEVSPT